MEFKNRPVKDGLFVSLSRAVYYTIALSGVPDTPAKQGAEGYSQVFFRTLDTISA